MKLNLIILAAIITIMVIIGTLNAYDIRKCVERGHSPEVCEHTFNR